MLTTYAISDIHGHADLLRAAHARIEADRRLMGDPEAPIVHLGDLTDHLLCDIGLDPVAALTEAAKPFWRA